VNRRHRPATALYPRRRGAPRFGGDWFGEKRRERRRSEEG